MRRGSRGRPHARARERRSPWGRREAWTPLRSEFSGRGDCTDIVIRTHRAGEPQLILPCYGDRIFGMAADDEMAFTFPFAMAQQVVRGLEGTHAGGVRYPVPVYLRFQAEYPKSYQELERRWARPPG